MSSCGSDGCMNDYDSGQDEDFQQDADDQNAFDPMLSCGTVSGEDQDGYMNDYDSGQDEDFQQDVDYKNGFDPMSSCESVSGEDQEDDYDPGCYNKDRVQDVDDLDAFGDFAYNNEYKANYNQSEIQNINKTKSIKKPEIVLLNDESHKLSFFSKFMIVIIITVMNCIYYLVYDKWFLSNYDTKSLHTIQWQVREKIKIIQGSLIITFIQYKKNNITFILIKKNIIFEMSQGFEDDEEQFQQEDEEQYENDGEYIEDQQEDYQDEEYQNQEDEDYQQQEDGEQYQDQYEDGNPDEEEGNADEYERYDIDGDQQEKQEDEGQPSRKSGQSYQYQQFEARKWQWATPLIEGVPPCPRGGHTATLSGASIVIFGGHYYAGKSKGYIYLNDTYVLDVNANRWHKPKISGTPPGPRYNHTAILAGSRIIIFGGKGQKCVFRDLHALDPMTMTWYQGPEGSGSPSARFGHSSSLFNGSKMLIFGGWNGQQFYNDLYILDLEVMAWTQPQCTGPSPTPRQGHTAVQVGSNLIVQGGFCFDEEKFKQAYKTSGNPKHGSHLTECYLNDLRILDTDHFIWSRLRVSGTPPLPRYGHTSNITGSDIVVFGGWATNSGARGEQNFVAQQDIDYFIVLSTEKMVWEKGRFEGVPPLNRYGHTATSIGPHVLIFGGWEYNRATNEVVVLRDMNMSGGAKKK